MSITLYRTDDSGNMARFYHLDIQPDFFGAWSAVKEWGRIGCTGPVRTASLGDYT